VKYVFCDYIVFDEAMYLFSFSNIIQKKGTKIMKEQTICAKVSPMLLTKADRLLISDNQSCLPATDKSSGY